MLMLINPGLKHFGRLKGFCLTKKGKKEQALCRSFQIPDFISNQLVHRTQENYKLSALTIDVLLTGFDRASMSL
jgi:hypothetical protein